MKIAVTYELGTGRIFQHFGHTEVFKLYNVDGTDVTSSELLSAEGSGHGALAGFLSAHGVDALICGGIGEGAKNALAAAGITLYGGCSGSADLAVNELIKGRLTFNSDATCSHHHDEGPSCGEHSCEEHSCGGNSCGGNSCGGNSCGGQ